MPWTSLTYKASWLDTLAEHSLSMLGTRRGLSTPIGTQGLNKGVVKDSTYHSCRGKARQLDHVPQEEDLGESWNYSARAFVGT